MRRAWRAAPRARWAAVAVLVVGVIVVIEVVSGSGSDTEGRPAPALPTTALQGPAVSIASLHGKPALIDFFASWCDPCHDEAPTLRKLSESLGGRATVVAIDWNDSDAPARAFVHKYGWKFPVLSDPSGSTGQQYGVDIGLPTSFVIDPEGEIVNAFLGPQSEAKLRQALLAAS